MVARMRQAADAQRSSEAETRVVEQQHLRYSPCTIPLHTRLVVMSSRIIDCAVDALQAVAKAGTAECTRS